MLTVTVPKADVELTPERATVSVIAPDTVMVPKEEVADCPAKVRGLSVMVTVPSAVVALSKLNKLPIIVVSSQLNLYQEL